MGGRGITPNELCDEMARVGVIAAGMTPRQCNAETLRRVIAGFDRIAANIEDDRAGKTAVAA
jgi:hypothetical protein